MNVRCLLAPLLLPLAVPAAAADVAPVVAYVDADAADNARISDAIWSYAELGYQETRSTALLQSHLRSAGFAIETGVAGMPTAFVASYGTGGPVIAILGEFDALPGLSQGAVPTRQPIAGQPAGHGCGHNLLGTAAMSAAIAVARWLKATGRAGTIRFYGAPAEEGGDAKVYMVRDGLFRDVDVALTWHPADANSANLFTANAIKSAKFRFRGKLAHAASAPHLGRSALDGVEAMNVMANMMREHMPTEARLHYVITSGGSAPNVVPENAEVYYSVRHPDAAVTEQLFNRLVEMAKGAAQGTETQVVHEVIGGTYGMLPNKPLQTLLHAQLSKVGGVSYREHERRFAVELQASLDLKRPVGRAREVLPLTVEHSAGSTDVGDISWNVPTGFLKTATFVPGTPFHSWQAAAASGMSIGHQGQQVAAKVLALAATKLIDSPALIAAARADLAKQRPVGFVYRPLLGRRPPALDYRK